MTEATTTLPPNALTDTLKRVWGYDAFRPLQREIIEGSLAGRDVVAILPTGAGKSLCYQLPAVVREGLTVVVSPLIALMKDQVDGLRSNGYPAAALHSGHLDAAALDVTPTEPPPPDSPLWTAPRLIITPHVAGQSARRIDAMTEFFCDNLGRYAEGRPLRNLVDKRLGFPEPPPDSTGCSTP